MLTLLLAVYNGMPYLEEMTTSLQRQTFPDFQVLVRDDGSRDGSIDFLEKLVCADSRFHLIRDSVSRLGPAGNFMVLLRKARGNVAFCDQDDVWAPDRLECGLETLRKAEATFGKSMPLLVHSDLRVIDGEGRLLYPSFVRHQGWDLMTTDLRTLLVTNHVTGSTMLINEPLRSLGAMAPQDIFMHDWWLAKVCAATGRLVPIPKCLVDYRQHGGNAVGASQSNPVSRIFREVRNPGKIRRRVTETFQEASAMLDTYGDILPEDARRVLRTYAGIPSLPRARRFAALRRGGFLAANPGMRLAQLLYS